MSSGSITRRGKSSWRIKFDIGRDPVTGKRRTQYLTVRGTKKDAQRELTKRLSEVDGGLYVERSTVTLAEYARHWCQSIAPAKCGAKTLERYSEIVEKTIIPQLGELPLQQISGTRIDEFYAHLRTAGRRDGKGGLAPQTVLHVHRLLSQIFSSAVKARKLGRSPMAEVQATPSVRREEVQVLTSEELARLFRHLKGKVLYMPVLVAASTGMRRGEVLALRWKDIDFAAATLEVRQVIEQTRDEGLQLKEPKTDRSRRTIALPARLLEELRQHRKEQAEHRLKLGLGKDDLDLVFPTWSGEIRNPDNFSKEFAREVAEAKLPHVTFHGLRHTHITHLLKQGVPIHVVSERAGHANPTVTLNIYAHVLPGQQEGAAAVVDAALRGALGE